jgi:hypothetical protein
MKDPTPRFRSLGSSSSSCLTKALLSDLALVLGMSSGLEVYRCYLSSSFNVNISHDTLSILDDSVLARFYNSEEPTRPPRYIDFRETSTWGRLENSLNIRLVLARAPERPGRPWMRIHDRRVSDMISPQAELSEPPTLQLFYAVTLEGKVFHLSRGLDPADFELTRFAETFAVDWERLSLSWFSKPADCYRMKVWYALGGQECPVHDHGDDCLTLYGLCTMSDPFPEWKERPFVLATHLSSRLLARRSFRPKDQSYQVLARFTEGAAAAAADGREIAATSVLLVRTDGSVVPVLPQHSEMIVQQHGRADRERHPLPGDYPGLDVEKSSASVDRRRWRNANDAEVRHCRGCEVKEDYRPNLDPGGGQRLFTYQMSTFDLLDMLGLCSEENVALIRKACDYSCLYYDVESCTILSKHPAGQEELTLDFKPLSDQRRGRKIVGKQIPVLIGLVDGLDLSDHSPPVILSSEPNCNGSSMVAEFVDLLLERRDRATVAKKELLSPLLSSLEMFKQHFRSFFRSEGFLEKVEPKEEEAAATTSCWADDDFEDSRQQEENFFREQEDLSSTSSSSSSDESSPG